MDWMLPLQSLPRQTGTGLSERLLRHLFLPRQLRAGTRVLDYGCGDGELTRFLDSQSIQAVGCDASATRIAAARRLAPHVPFYCADLTDPAARLPVPDHDFDLVLARGLAGPGADLTGHDALRVTANLLAALKPGGELILVERSEVDARGALCGHLRSCFARHLGTFPGIVRVALVADSIFEHRSVSQALGLQSASGFVTASLKLDAVRRTRVDWLGFAEREAAGWNSPCCEWGAHNALAAPFVDRAA